MKFFSKMERKWGRHSINGLTKYIIICYAVGYLIYFINPAMIRFITLEPAYILRGQIWRLVSWVLVPPGAPSIFTFIMLFFYYSIGTTLERTWGEFRYNVYIFGGLLFTIIGAFICFFAGSAIVGGPVTVGSSFSTYYVSMSIFLGFAATYPDMQVLLYFIIPLKVKWLGFVYIAFIIYDMINMNWLSRIAVFASLLNFVVFFLMTRNFRRVSPKEVKRRRDFQKATESVRKPGVTKHKCAVCGRTEEDDPNLEFRFCSKCNGNYEYCQDHLFTHEHVK